MDGENEIFKKVKEDQNDEWINGVFRHLLNVKIISRHVYMN